MKSRVPMLRVSNLNARFGTFALRDISLEVHANERIGIVGESGSGKSLLAKLLMGLAQGYEICGEIALQGVENNLATCALDSRIWRTIRAKHIAYIPQSPKLALNPLHTIAKQLEEMCALHIPITQKSQYHTIIDSALESVGLQSTIKHRLPHTLSGGQAQRVCIAMMVLARPKILICDEPTTALDAHIQSQILTLLDSFSETTMILISHDLGIIKRFTNRLYVMQNGRICDHIATTALDSKDSSALHPYTRRLMHAMELPRKIVESHPGEVCLALRDFAAYYTTKGFFTKHQIPAIQGVNMSLRAGESVGIIGASGSGKSSLALGVLGLERHSGVLQIFVRKSHSHLAQSFTYVDTTRDDKFISMVQVVFQDPLLALNPRMCVLEILQEALSSRYNQARSFKQENALQHLCIPLLEQVGLSSDFLYRYSANLSGGEAQRVCIARALASGARILLLDEPTSALDKSTQKDLITLLLDLQQTLGLSYLVISHDLNVIEAMCREVLVLDSGQVVEQGELAQIFSTPKHSYTQALLASRI